MQFTISRPKLFRLPRNKKQTYRLNAKPQMWPSDFNTPMTLTLKFQGQIWNSLYLGQKWCDYHEQKQTYRLNIKPQIWPSDLTLTLNFQVKYGICYILAKIVRLPINKKQTSLKCGDLIWPWPWPCPWNFKVKYEIDYISAKNSPIAMKQKANMLIELQASNVTIGFYMGSDLDYEVKYVIWPKYLSQRWFDCHKMKSTHMEWTEGLSDHQVWPWPWPGKVRCKDLSDSDWGDFRCRWAIDSSNLILLEEVIALMSKMILVA